jgi:7-cyano-7-deazaguanine synthase
MTKVTKKAVIILSGGLDSTTLLYDLVKKYGNKEILAISFNYGSKHSKWELSKAMNTCFNLKVEHKVLDIQSVFSLFKSSLLDHKDSEAIPEGHYEDENMKSTVVPFRNGILLSLAVGIAESYGINKVFYGAHGGDHECYPDCRPDFLAAINDAGKFGTYINVEIKAPYMKMNKVSILKKGVELGVDYKNTHTCYNPNNAGQSCGKCGSCQERLEAFEKNGIKDPLEYYNK